MSKSTNVVADTFSRLSRSDTPTSSTAGTKHRLAADNNTSEFDDDTPLDNFFSLTEDSEMLKYFTCLPSEECYINLPDDLVTDNPLNMENIKEKQDADNALQQHTEKYSDRFLRRRIGTVDNILCYVKPGDPPNNWKIALPKELLQPTIQWWTTTIDNAFLF
jgi:hypothetical protein